ncbi:MAG: hypothetical protein ACYCYI_03810 [Saccharofermentanales bacterium]
MDNDKIIKIINNNKFVFDSLTGGILSLQTTNGVKLIDTDRKTAGLIDLAYPLDNFGPLRLATPYSVVKNIETNENSVVIEYSSLGPSRDDAGYEGTVSAKITLSAHEDGKSVVFEAQIENHTDKLIPQILFPDFKGLVPVSGYENTWFRRGGVKIRPFLEIGKNHYNGVNNFWRGCWWEHFGPRVMYGFGSWWGGTSLGRWAHYGSLKAGIGVYDEGWYPDIEHSVYIRICEDKPERARMCFTRENPSWNHMDGNLQIKPDEGVSPGSSWESRKFIITPHQGGWPKGIENYRRFVQTHNCIDLPEHVKNEIGFKTIFMAESQEYKQERCEYLWKDLPALAKECKDAGISEINCWSGNEGFKLPIPIRTILGTEEEFTEAMRECKDIGVNVSMFISVSTLDPETSRKFGGAGTRESGWSYHTEAIPAQNPGYYTSYAGSPMNTSNEAWQDAVLESIDTLIEKGALSISWDEYMKYPGIRTIDYLAAEILRRTKIKNAMATFATECTTTYETESMLIHYTWNWREVTIGLFNTPHKMADYAAPALSVWRAPRMNLNVEDDPAKIIKGFTDNFYINFMMRKSNRIWGSAKFSDYPQIHSLIKNLTNLRRKFLQYFTQGILLGDGVMDKDWTLLHTAGYSLSDRLLLFIVNDRSRTYRKVKVGIDLQHWLGDDFMSVNFKIYNIKGECELSENFNGHLFRYTFDSIKKNELYVIEIISVINPGN